MKSLLTSLGEEKKKGEKTHVRWAWKGEGKKRESNLTVIEAEDTGPGRGGSNGVHQNCVPVEDYERKVFAL